VLRDFVDNQWTGVYPRLDPDDDNDPTMRVNVLGSIADAATVTGVRATALVSSRTLGRFSLKDLEIASGDAQAPAGTEPVSMASLDAAALDCDLPELQETAAAAKSAGEALAALELSVAAQVGAVSGVSFGKLIPLVRKASNFLAAKVALRAPAGASVTDGATDVTGGGASMASRGGSPGEISSREDVVRALDKISAYYERHEPSSPIPLFMARCKRLVMMSFIDIVRELVPDAISQVEVLKGRTE
jgi:type VI secretion system protein ImpA